MVAALQSADPARIGPYRLVGVLGSGGMGRVYLGRSRGGMQVAVKVIKSEAAADPQFRTRFAREVAAAQRVNGLYTAVVVAADPDASLPWLATAYINAPSLADLIRDGGPLPADRLRSLAAGLAEGLAAIHAAGVVHRDLKPSNVLITTDGPKIIDFGIASATGLSSLTGSNTIVGSPGYMSPEQAQAGREIGPASDIFSLGAVLCYAAVGRTPWGDGSQLAMLFRVVHEEPDLVGVTGEIRALAERCLAKDLAQRPLATDILAEFGESGPPDDLLGSPLALPGTSPVEESAVPAPEPIPGHTAGAGVLPPEMPDTATVTGPRVAAKALPAKPKTAPSAPKPAGSRRRDRQPVHHDYFNGDSPDVILPVPPPGSIARVGSGQGTSGRGPGRSARPGSASSSARAGSAASHRPGSSTSGRSARTSSGRPGVARGGQPTGQRGRTGTRSASLTTGAVLFCFGLAILFAASIWVRMPNGVGQWIFGLAGSVVGDGAFAIPALFVLLGRWFIRNPDRNFGDSPAGIGWAAVLAGALGLLHIANGLPTLSRATGGWPAVRAAGGVVGMLASWPLDKGLTPWGAIPALALLACYGILVLTGTPVREVPQRLRELKMLFGLQVDDEWEPEDTDEVDGADVLRRGELGRGAIRLNGGIDPSDR